MKRRRFLEFLALAPAAARAQEGPSEPDPVERDTAPPKPAIALCHTGFRPDARKTVIFRLIGGPAPEAFSMYEVGSGSAFRVERPLRPTQSDLGRVLTGDFSDIQREGMYQIRIGDELSVPFFIRPDAWRRILPTVVGYHKYQRCGVAVPNVHPACHLDDSRRRDDGRHVDTTGGWHDAGDLRKWMDATMMNAFGLLRVARNLGAGWNAAGVGLDPIFEEVRWGNRYFRKMQDTDGRVWADVGGGVNGDNSDNHWTDNRIGTADDRYLNPAKPGQIQAMFVALQAMMARELRNIDQAYAADCLAAARRCWDANKPGGGTRELSWWTIAACEMYRATGDAKHETTLAQLATKVAALQEPNYVADQKIVRGFWRMGPDDPEPYRDAVDSALPGIALLEAAAALPKHADAVRWQDAVRLYITGYVLPMTARSAYGILPFGVFRGSPTNETYRPLAGGFTYRFFMPARKQFWWLGLNAHLGCCAALLAQASRQLKEAEWRNIAYRQFEWMLGANPFGVSLMTGEGTGTPFPHSRYVGLIPGGILNGICGNTSDEPVLDTRNDQNWRTNEYWSPHVAYFEWAHAWLEM